MGSNSEIARKEMARIVEALEKEKNAKCEMYLRGTAKQIALMVLGLMDGFHHVTGNTINSVAVGLYFKKKLRYVATSAEELNHPATRVTLHEGERYDLPEYWDGSVVKKGYVGETEGGGEWGEDLAKWLIAEGVTLPRDWVFKVVVGVPYARYLEQVKGASVITEAHDMLRSAGGEVTEIT